MFSPIILGAAQIIEVYPGGVGREHIWGVLGRYENASPERVDSALAKLLKLGVVEAKGDLFVPLPPLEALVRKMERLVRRINRQEEKRDQAMALVKMLFRP
jgi:hypothetical protein